MSETHINASKCSKCKKAVYPPRNTCPFCGVVSEPSIIIKINNRGTVLSYTTLFMCSDEFTSPVRLALVRLDMDVTILCLADEDEDQDIAIGSQVELTYDSETRIRYRVLN